MLSRFGQPEVYDERTGTAWGSFFQRQFYRAGAAAAPYSLVRACGYDFPTQEVSATPLAPALYGVADTCAALSFARRILGERLGEPIGGGLALAAAAAVVAPVFALSVFQVGQLDRNPGEAEREKTAFDRWALSSTASAWRRGACRIMKSPR